MAFVKLEEKRKNHEITLLVFRLEEKVSPIPSHGSDILYTSFRLALRLSLISQIILSQKGRRRRINNISSLVLGYDVNLIIPSLTGKI